jgi:hypothetical protein
LFKFLLIQNYSDISVIGQWQYDYSILAYIYLSNKLQQKAGGAKIAFRLPA